MKNRKAPVVLFGVVVVAIAGMAVLNAANQPLTPEAMMEHKEEAVHDHETTPEERAATTQKALDKLPDKAAPAGGVSRGPNGKLAVAMEESPGTSMAMSTVPTILIDEFKPIAPKPNDNSTATHWYDEESRSSKIASENQKSRG